MTADVRGSLFTGMSNYGVWIRQGGPMATIKNNTFVACVRALRFEEDAEVTNNVFAYSVGPVPAVTWDNRPDFTSGCNLYWANAEGDARDSSFLRPTDLVGADPLFCDEASGDFTLRKDSPALTGPCGQVGAFGQGCGTVSLDPATWSRVKAMYRGE